MSWKDRAIPVGRPADPASDGWSIQPQEREQPATPDWRSRAIPVQPRMESMNMEQDPDVVEYRRQVREQGNRDANVVSNTITGIGSYALSSPTISNLLTPGMRAGIGAVLGTEAIRARAASGEAQADFAQNDGYLDRTGALAERAVGSALGGADRFVSGLMPEGRAQEVFRARARPVEAAQNTAVAGETTWEDVKADPVRNLLPFIHDTAIGSAPEMAITMTPGIGMIMETGIQSGRIGQNRAVADGREDATGGDILAAAPFAAVSAALERTGALEAFGNAGGNFLSSFFRKAGAEGATEFGQEFVENAGGTVGTEQGFDLVDTLDQSAGAALGGAGMGGGISVVQDGGRAAVNRITGRARPQAPLSPEDRSSPLPDDLIGEGRATVGRAMGDARVIMDAPVATGGRVSVTMPNGAVRSGTLEQAGSNVSVAFDDGSRLDQPLDMLVDAGVRLAPGSPLAEADAIDASLATSVLPAPGARPAPAARPAAPAAAPQSPTAPVGQNAREDFKARVRVSESGGRDNAANPRGSASGRYQFIESTFKTLYQRVYRANPQQAAEAWANNRFDPQVQERLMDAAIGEYSAAFRRAGIPETAGNLYLAHFLGPAGAVSALRVDPRTPTINHFGEAIVNSNPEVMRGKTVGDVIAWTRRRMGGPAPAGGMDAATGEAPIMPDLQMTEFDPVDFGNGPERAPLPVIPMRAEERQDTAVTTTGREVPVQYAVVELRDLIASNDAEGNTNPSYPAERQPRDRTRVASRSQVQDIAANLNPRLLGRSPKASDGAPIISPDGVVESGNGRTIALQLAYAQGGEKVDAYRQMIEGEGFDTSGMDQPVLVRARDANMAPEEVDAFIREANSRDTAAMSGTESAQSDADAMPAAMLDLYRGGDIDAAGNRDFVRAFMQAVVPVAEQGQMVMKDGQIAKPLLARMEAAVLVRAFGRQPFVEKLVDATDSNIRTIGKALIETGGSFAKLREASMDGRVDPAMDISNHISEAVEIVDRARRENRPVASFVQQRDIFSGETVHPLTEAVLRMMYARPDFTRPVSQKRLVEALNFYLQEAEKAAPGGGLFGESTKATPDGILQLANEKSKRTPDDGEQPDLLRPSQSNGSDGGGVPAPGRDDGGPGRAGVQAQSGDEGSGESVAPEPVSTGEPASFADFVKERDAAAARAPDLPPEQVAPDAQKPESVKAEAAPASTARIEPGSTDKSIVVVGASKAELAAIAEAVPNAKPTPPRKSDGGVSFSKKHEDKIRAALEGVTKPVTPTSESVVGKGGESGEAPPPKPASGGGSVDLVYVSKEGTQVRNLIPGTPAPAKPVVDSTTTPSAAEPTAKPEPSPNRLVTDDRAAELREKLKAKLNPNRLNAGIDPEIIAIGTELAVYHIEKGARRFQAFATAIAGDLGMAVKDLRQYLRGWYNGARDMMEDSGESVAGMDTPDEVGKAMRTLDQWAEAAPVTPAAEPIEPAASGIDPTVAALADHFSNGGSFSTIVEARKFIADRTGEAVKPGTAESKRADEAIEAAVVQAARKIVARDDSPLATYRALVDLYQRQPSLNVRTSTSVEQQAYSTPVPLAYLASQRAGIGQDTTVYEPSAGNGALLIGARATYVTANELNPDRAAQLRSLYRGAKISQDDATAFTPPGPQRDVVIANPPFGPVKDEAGETRIFNLGDGYQTREIDHAISMLALDSMKNGGKAVLIVGSIAKTVTDPKARRDAYNGKAKREFYYRLYSEYNVTDHFTVAGELYSKQGAGWPVDVIVIEGRGKSALTLPAIEAPRQYASWDALEEALDPVDAVSPEAGRPNVGADPQRAESAGSDAGDRAGSRTGRADRPGVDAAPDGRDDLFSRPADREPGGGRLDESAARTDAAAAENSGRAATDRPAPVKREVAVQEGGKQVSYQPASGSKSLDTLVPFNMQTAIGDALDRLQSRVGGVDGFVADRLGYDEKAIGDYFSAEQVDALALAIDNMERGAGFIIGDQTGIGKGRVVAGVIRYAMRQGRTPIFVTEKPNLYADMYRDMVDVGIPDMLGRDLNILMTNAAERVPLNDDGSKELKTPSAQAHNAALRRVAEGGGEQDVVFTTYSQMQSVKGAVTERQLALQAMAPGAILIFDESHNAGGQGQNARGKQKKGPDGQVIEQAPNRAEFARRLAGLAHGVFFSSATYAKRPDVMDLYASTDMKYAVADINQLGEAISKGGIPLQQTVASALAAAGQYIRRERSFAGVEYRTPTVTVDRKAYSQFTAVLQSIQDFQENHIADALEAIDDEVRAEAKSISFDGSVGKAGATSTNFTSVMHNLIEQMLLSMKAEAAANKAIEAIRDGRKPVITVANTMGSFLAEYAEENSIGNGGEMPLDFRALLYRYLDRTRRIVVRRPFSSEKGEVLYISDSNLGPAGVEAFDAVKRRIEAMPLEDVPISPIDHIRQRIMDAGFKVGEITGRDAGLDYSGDVPRFRMRGGKERSIQGRRDAITGFNSGTIDAMILNQAGSTGLSLHASATFKDQRRRHMIIAQAERNIDTHMQMLGRVHRTGQVIAPEYDQLVAGVPAEMRPAAVLAKKMASLNANTTGARDSAMSAEDIPDFMNEYGDEVAARMMEEEPDLHRRLAKPLKGSDKKGDDGFDREDAARRVTGRLMLLPLDEQEAFYERFLGDYQDLLQQKEAAGEATLEAKTLPLDAKVISSSQVIAQTKPDTPFGEAVNLEKLNVKRLGKPYTPEMVLSQIGETVGAEQVADLDQAKQLGSAWAAKFTQEAADAFAAYRKETLDNTRSEKVAEAGERLQSNLNRFRSIMRNIEPGSGIALTSGEDGSIYGVVTKVERKGKAANPLALGTYRVTVALADAAQRVVIPFSQLRTNDMGADFGGILITPAKAIGRTPILDAFKEMQTESREDRFMFTGNILAAFDHTNGKGQIVNFIGDDGSVRSGIMMRRGYDYGAEMARQPVAFRTPAQVAEWLRRGELILGDHVSMQKEGSDLIVTVAAAKSVGGDIYLDRAVRDALGSDFYKKSNGMTATVAFNRVEAVAAAIMAKGAILRAKTNIEEARKLLGEGAPSDAKQSRSRSVPGTAEIDPVALRERLKALGLSDKVTMAVVDSLGGAAGDYGAGGQAIVRIARDTAQEGRYTLDHEAIHALREMGLFTKSEWSMLEAAAKRDAALMRSIARRYSDLETEAQLEEAVADMFARWSQGQTERGVVARLFQRLRDLFDAVRNALRGDGFKSAGGVMRAVDRGDVGRRQSDFPDLGDGQFFGSIPRQSRVAQSSGLTAAASTGVRAKIDDALDRFRTGMQDRYLPLLRVQQRVESATGKPLPLGANPYLREELMTGRVGYQLERFSDKMIDPLFTALHQSGVTPEELETFLYARHAPERNAQIAKINPAMPDGGSGMSDIEAAAIMTRVKRSGRMDKLEALASMVDEINQFALKTRIDAGLLSPDEAEAWQNTYEHYVPLRGQEEVKGNATGLTARINRSGGGITVTGKEAKRAYGRRSQADNILAYTLLQAEEAIVRAETNRVAQSFVNLAQRSPDPEYWEVNKVTRKAVMDSTTGLVRYENQSRVQMEDKDYTVTAKVNGEEIRVTMNRYNPSARRLADSMRNLTQHQVDWFVQIFGIPSRFLSAVNTSWNPEFIITNAFRDIQSAALNIAGLEKDKLLKGTMRDYRKALVAATKGEFGKGSGEWSRWYHEFKAEGGATYFNKVDNLDDLKMRISNSMTKAEGRLSVKRGFLAVRDTVEALNGGVENAVRLSVYKNARELGMAKSEAASIAKNVTVNFNRRGQFGPLMNAAYMFFNASVQGTARLGLALRSKRVRKVMAGVVVGAFLLELLNAMLSDDDDDGEAYYDKISAFDKNRNFIFMIPGGNGEHIKIPMPYGYNVFAALGRTTAEVIRRGGDGAMRSMGEFGSAVADAFNPVGGAESLLNLLSPTLLDPLVDLTRNRDYMDRPIMPEENQYGPQEPDAQRYFSSVSPVWRAVTDTLTQLTGGDDIVAGTIDISPETLEYLAQTMAGAAGAFFDRQVSLGAKAIDPDAEIEASDLPLARKVFAAKPSWYDRSAYYDRVNQVEQSVSDAGDYLEIGDRARFESYVNANEQLLTLEGDMKAARRDMRAIRKAKGELELGNRLGRIDDATYRRELQVTRDAEDIVIQRFNTRWNEVMHPRQAN